MLFFPGAISQALATILFFALVSGGIYSYARMYYQQQRIDYLSAKVREYEVLVEGINQRESFYKKNLEVLQRNCNRRTKPVITNNSFNVENLFNVNPK